jgi:hypothetical protein
MPLKLDFFNKLYLKSIQCRGAGGGGGRAGGGGDGRRAGGGGEREGAGGRAGGDGRRAGGRAGRAGGRAGGREEALIFLFLLMLCHEASETMNAHTYVGKQKH